MSSPAHPRVQEAHVGGVQEGGGRIRLIPTYREHTVPVSRPPSTCWAHPHVQGTYKKVKRVIRNDRGSSPRTGNIPACKHTQQNPEVAHPHVQGTYSVYGGCDENVAGSSPRTGNIRFLTRYYASRQPEKYSVSCIEMSRQFLVYGGHTLNEGLGLDASPLPIYRLAVRGVPIDGLWGSTSI